jgi:hypothetical protein
LAFIDELLTAWRPEAVERAYALANQSNDPADEHGSFTGAGRSLDE